jgi:hypothetical protein
MPENRDRSMTANAWRYIALHSAGGAAFGFVLQYFALSATLETSVLWAVAFGVAAAGLAWHQSKR